MFQVTTLMPPKGEPMKMKLIENEKKEKVPDYNEDFFKKPAYLTVSGQLNVESYCCSMSNVYTFGPTFRAEKSHTTRHLAEFWMIEPEIAFADLQDDMSLAEDYLKFCVKYALENNLDDIKFCEEKLKKEKQVQFLENIVNSKFAKITYTEVIEILKKAQANGKKFEYNDIKWGMDLQSEHERYVAEEYVKGPFFAYNYPKEIKAFYMRQNDDGKTVTSMDLLVPLVGEVIGGSQREERLDVLEKRMKELKMDLAPYWWYLDLRKYGSIPHAGFGLGFERLIMMVTGIENIRDVIPYFRSYEKADY